MIVRNKYSLEEMSTIKDTSIKDADRILEQASDASAELSNMPLHERYSRLVAAASLIDENSAKLAELIAAEAGKPLKYAREEVRSASLAMSIAAEEGRRIHGETVPVDGEERGVNTFAFYTRVPLGIVMTITGHADPLAMVVEKAAPAIAAGNAVISMPSEHAPLSALELARIIEEAGFPQGALQTVIASGPEKILKHLMKSGRISLAVSSGIPPHQEAPIQEGSAGKYMPDHDGNSTAIVWGDADLDQASERIASGAFSNQGQGRMRVQRVLVKDEVYDYIKNRLIEIASGLSMGDPMEAGTEIGPLVSGEAAESVFSMIQEAKEGGAIILIGGQQEGSFVTPTLLEGVTADAIKEDVKGPVLSISRINSMQEAIDIANSFPHRIQAGVFTSDLDMSMHCTEKLDYSAVLINDSPPLMVNTLPIAGAGSRAARQGIRFAVEDMSRLKLTIIKR